MELSIILPCLNEDRTLGACIKDAQNCISKNGYVAEIIVADNGSTDNSIKIANEAGARVIHVEKRGYGAALITGIENAKGKYCIMADSDQSYDLSKLEPFLEKLRDGNDLVIGNRFKGGIEKGAMPFLHRYLGNPVLSFLGRLFFDLKTKDFHCGLRGFKTDIRERLHLSATGMEFASEMIVKASIAGLSMDEVPIILRKDGRDRAPHLKTWSDGWRHLQFLLMFAPFWLYWIPALFFFVFGSTLVILTGSGHFEITDNVYLDNNSFVMGVMMLAASVFIFGFGLLADTLSSISGVKRIRYNIDWIRKKFTLGFGLILGSTVIAAGVILFLSEVFKWSNVGFGNLDPVHVRTTALSAFSILVGLFIVFFSFFIDFLKKMSASILEKKVFS